jgi:hypothetical protein
VRGFTSWPRPLLLALAFAAATTLYSALWMYGVRAIRFVDEFSEGDQTDDRTLVVARARRDQAP